ncbi:CDP-glycerol glycerophosphotransferase domain protein [Candidatus Magnetomorum sp. HK-1]|nr:CDP-glycerol glycerophosphotransferase domain protein [Candidatus Magnetomorum sp. HK-1]
MKSLLFSLTNLATQPLSEFLLYQKLKKEGLNIDMAAFSFDRRFKEKVTDSIVRPRSLAPFQKECIKFSANKYNFLKSKDLSYYLQQVSHVLTRQAGKNTDLIVLDAIEKQSHDIKHIVYVMNTVGAGVGLSQKQPDYYLCPGLFWEKLLKDNKSFLTGLKKYDLPFLTEASKKYTGNIISSGLVSWLEVEDSKKHVSKEAFINAYEIKNKFIIFCIESTPKYIDDKGNIRGNTMEWTLNTLAKLKNLLGKDYDILIKGHPFQYYKPYPWYNRKQVQLNIFEKYGKILRADDGYHAFRFADFAVTGNSSVSYEAALCGCTSIAIADKESDYYSNDGIFTQYLTPELYGFLFDNFKSLEHNIDDVIQHHNDKERRSYIEEYGNTFNTENLIHILGK